MVLIVKPYFKAYGFNLFYLYFIKQTSKIIFYKSGLKKSLVFKKALLVRGIPYVHGEVRT